MLKLCSLAAVCVCGVSILFAGGCTVLKYYDIAPLTNQQLIQGSLSFKMYSMDWDLQRCNDSTIYSDSRYTPEMLDFYSQYRDFQVDTLKTYWSILICHDIKWVQNTHTRLRVDSIAILLQKNGSKIPYEGLVHETITHDRCPYAASIFIGPIGIPKGYKDTWSISFVLSIFDAESDDLQERIPVELESHWRKKLYPIHP
ncbi:MAG: hypothetical protein KOO62_09850 [candidate division Zixibacteria bacterium]|nr:hypothetical protein [candidate division Zixibacteria bacterium]